MISSARLSLSPVVRIFTLLLLSFVPHPVTSSSYVSVSSYSCGSSTGVDVTSFDVDCDQCSFGSKATLTMGMDFNQDQTEQAYATAWLTKSYIKFLTLYSEKEINICGGAESTSGSECPAAGSYEISTGIDIPEYDGWVTGFQAHVAILDTDGVLMLSCVATISAGYQMYYRGAALGGVVLLGLLFQRKWKNERVMTEEDHANFEMMTDPHTVNVHSEMSNKEGVVV